MAGRRGNNEGTIRKRDDGRWEARISLPGGKQKAFYAKTRQEVARKLAEATRDRDKGITIVVDGRQTLRDYLKSWFEMTRPAVKPKTYRSYEQLLRCHVMPTLGTIPLVKLTPAHLKSLWAAKLEEGKSGTTINHVHAVLHKALTDAQRLGAVAQNVADLVDPPRMTVKEMHPLTSDEVRQLLEAARGDRFEALYALAVTTGMREGELLALKWREVELDSGLVQVKYTLQRIKGKVTFVEPKTRRSRRNITLSDPMVEVLRAHRKRQLEERLQTGAAWEDHNLVFCNSVGKPLEGTHILRRQFYPLLKRAGLPQIRFHDLRHTAATLLLGKGTNPKIVSEMLGHSSIAITLDTYSHVLPNMQQQAAAAMGALLTGF